GRTAGEGQVQARGEAARVGRRVDALLSRLVGRDLRDVEHIADVEPVTGDLDPCKVVDREIAERVCLRGCRREQRGGERGDDEERVLRVAKSLAAAAVS